MTPDHAVRGVRFFFARLSPWKNETGPPSFEDRLKIRPASKNTRQNTVRSSMKNVWTNNKGIPPK
jgi:hypothetical protein